MADLSTRVAAGATAALVGSGGMGVYADCLPPTEPTEFAAELSRALGRPFRLALLGWGETPDKEFQNGWTFSATVANVWRNDEATRSGVPLIVATSGIRPKLTSLRSALPLLTDGDLRDALRLVAVSWFDTPARNALWVSLTSMPERFPLASLIRFAAAVEQEAGRHSLSGREAMAMSHLGLLADPTLPACRGEMAATRALARNLDLVASLRPLSRRHAMSLATAARGGDPARRRVAKALLAYAETGSASALEGVILAEAAELLAPAGQVHANVLPRKGPPSLAVGACARAVPEGQAAVGSSPGCEEAPSLGAFGAGSRIPAEAKPTEGPRHALECILSRLLGLAPYLRFGVEVAALDPPDPVGLAEAMRAASARRAETESIPFRLRIFHSSAPLSSGVSSEARSRLEETGGTLTEERATSFAAFGAALAGAPVHLALVPFEAAPAEAFAGLRESAVWLAIPGIPPGFRVPELLALDGPPGLKAYSTANRLADRLIERTLTRGGLVPDAPTVRRTVRFAMELGADPFPPDDDGCRSLVRLVAAAAWHSLRVPGQRLVPLGELGVGAGIALLACVPARERGRRGEIVAVTGPDGFRQGSAGILLSCQVAAALDVANGVLGSYGGSATIRARGLPGSGSAALARVLAVEIGSLREPRTPSAPAAIVSGPGGLKVECFRLLESEAPAGNDPCGWPVV